MRQTIGLISAALIAACASAEPDTSDTARPESATPSGALIDWSQVDSALGRTGAIQPGDVHRYGMPRGDLKVTVDGVVLRPTFALGSWIAFKAHDGVAVAMGDLVLTDTELAPVIARLKRQHRRAELPSVEEPRR